MNKLLIMAVAVMSLVSCTRTPRLVIVHANDIHSHFEPVREYGDSFDIYRGGIIERAAFLDSVRNAVGAEKVLYVNAGDFSQGSSYFSELGGDLEVEEQNALGLDCATLGNHEFDNGLEALARRLKNIKCPVVCANLDLSPFELGTIVKPYTIVERGGMKIGIIGLAPDISTNIIRSVAARIPQLDAVEVTNKYVAELRAQSCDLVMLLSHSGYERDQEIISQVSGVDLVVGGHTHTVMDGFFYQTDKDGKKVPIIQNGCWGLDMGEITVY